MLLAVIVVRTGHCTLEAKWQRQCSIDKISVSQSHRWSLMCSCTSGCSEIWDHLFWSCHFSFSCWWSIDPPGHRLWPRPAYLGCQDHFLQILLYGGLHCSWQAPISLLEWGQELSNYSSRSIQCDIHTPPSSHPPIQRKWHPPPRHSGRAASV